MLRWLGLLTVDLPLLLGCLAPRRRRQRVQLPVPERMLDGRHVLRLAPGSPVIDVVAPLRDERSELFWLCLQICSTKTSKVWVTEKDVDEDLH